MFFKIPFFWAFFFTNGYILSTFPWNVGKIKFTFLVLVFWECEAVSDKFTEGYPLNVLEYEIEEFNVLFKKFGVLIWFKDSLK